MQKWQLWGAVLLCMAAFLFAQEKRDSVSPADPWLKSARCPELVCRDAVEAILPLRLDEYEHLSAEARIEFIQKEFPLLFRWDVNPEGLANNCFQSRSHPPRLLRHPFRASADSVLL